MEFYSGTKLLSMKDINGEKPEIFISTSNRSAGKTTFFNKWALSGYVKTGSKFMLIYRFKYELDDCAEKFFKDIGWLFFNGKSMSSKKKGKGVYHELYLDGESCGYAVSLNDADQIKKMSHLFSDVQVMLFDEFQSESNHYTDNEVKKLISIHTSVARGGGKNVRYVPLIMISNPVSLINPYYTALGISNRLKSETKFLRGDGFVLEQGFNESASIAQRESAFNRAFSQNEYVAYASQNVYLNDNTAFIRKPESIGRYLVTLKYKGGEYAIREYQEEGIVYCDNRPDKSYPYKIAVTTEDHNINYVMLKGSDFFLTQLRYYFDKGCFRFKDLKCKEAVLSALSY